MKSIRILGLAAFAALALIAFPAAASASGGLESEATTTELLAENVEGKHRFIFNGFESSCSTWFESTVAARVSTVAISPHWNSCSVGTVTEGSCKLEFHPGSSHSVDIGPAGCGPITYKLGECKATIGAQSGLPATYENIGTGKTASLKIKVAAKLTATGVGIPCNGAKSVEYLGTWEVRGYNLAGEQVGIHAVDEFPVGYYIAGSPPKLTAESYSASVTGDQAPSSNFGIEMPYWGEFHCSTSQFTGEATAATAELSTQGIHSGCTVGGWTKSVTVNMNSCKYAFGVTNSGPPYVGTLSLKCATEGDAVKLLTSSGFGACTISIPAQQLGTVAYENTGAGTGRKVVAKLGGGKEISYSWEKCFFGTGSEKNGSLRGSVTLRAFN